MSVSKWIYLSCVLVMNTESSRLNIASVLARDFDQWQICESHICSRTAATVHSGLPNGNANIPVHRGFLCRAPMWHFTGLEFQQKLDRFHEILHGGRFGSTPKRPLLFDMDKQLCGTKEVQAPQATLSVARHSMLDLTCFRLLFQSSSKSVCGCFSDTDTLAPPGKVRSLPAQLRDGCDFFAVAAPLLQDSIQEYPKPVNGHRQFQAMHSCPAVATSSLGGTLCTVSWNVGSEDDRTGIGWGGLTKEELRNDLTKLVMRECTGASVVAVSIQEGADPLITAYLHEIAHGLSTHAGKPMRLRANAFAGADFWHDGEPVKGLNGLQEVTAYKIKDDVLVKVWGYSRVPRKVVLTGESLLLFEVSMDLREKGTPLGPPVEVLVVDNRLSVELEKSTGCFTVNGFSKEPKPVSIKLCDEDNGDPGLSATLWVSMIEDAVKNRHLNQLEEVVLGRKPREEQDQDIVELPFAKGVSVAVMSLALPSKVKLFAVDFNCATENGECKKDTLASRAKQWARNMTFTTAEKGGAIVRLEFDGKAICFAGCHMEAKKREKRWLQAKLMSDSLAKLDCDAEVWMGDFNTRPTNSDGSNKCCPWNEVELYTTRNSADKLRQLTVSHDDMRLMPGLQAETSVYEEMPITFPPTFHKRLKRDGMDQCSSFPESQTEEYVADLVASGSLAQENISDDDILAALIAANSDSLSQEKCSAGKANMCYGGLITKDNCESGGCFNSHDAGHCPGYTDRIVYRPGHMGESGPILSPCNYVAIPNFVSADHTPVAATFTIAGVDVGEPVPAGPNDQA